MNAITLVFVGWRFLYKTVSCKKLVMLQTKAWGVTTPLHTMVDRDTFIYIYEDKIYTRKSHVLLKNIQINVNVGAIFSRYIKLRSLRRGPSRGFTIWHSAQPPNSHPSMYMRSHNSFYSFYERFTASSQNI